MSERKIRSLAKQFCNCIHIKLVFFSTFKLRNIFSVKDIVPREPRSYVVYKVSCASCDACLDIDTFSLIWKYS